MKQMKVDDVRDILNHLQQHGIEFTVVGHEGHYSIGPDDVLAFIKDPDQYWADAAHVSLEHYLRWRDFFYGENYGRCTGTTLKGTRCKNLSCDPYKDVRGFVFGVHDRCSCHREALPESAE